MQLEKSERDALIKALSTTIKEFVSQELKPILDRLAAAEQAQNAIKAEISNIRRSKGASDAAIQ
jgi:hypothetical protein